MTSLIESIKKGPVMTMTLQCETDFPKALKDNMKSLGFEGEALYKGFPFMDEGQEYWWVQLHIYKSKDDNHRTEVGSTWPKAQRWARVRGIPRRKKRTPRGW